MDKEYKISYQLGYWYMFSKANGLRKYMRVDKIRKSNYPVIINLEGQGFLMKNNYLYAPRTTHKETVYIGAKNLTNYIEPIEISESEAKEIYIKGCKEVWNELQNKTTYRDIQKIRKDNKNLIFVKFEHYDGYLEIGFDRTDISEEVKNKLITYLTGYSYYDGYIIIKNDLIYITDEKERFFKQMEKFQNYKKIFRLLEIEL